ncbi:hypothetical protein NXT3_PC00255 (plasmid) [Sinorhizobium fredii]|uniref:Uncharacterized protein n=1 Tax=Rhizobium fredii TaxID=380 RepID=A0A2L0HF73_RHIFR|nr:hypothetical protein NXT3_PC00255 [Sinorhizobium fredii]
MVAEKFVGSKTSISAMMVSDWRMRFGWLDKATRHSHWTLDSLEDSSSRLLTI